MGIVQSLKRARQHEGASLSSVAQRSGIGATNLSAIENSRRDPTTVTVQKIASALGVAFVPVLAQGRSTVAESASLIASAVTSQDPRLPYRQFIQLADDLASADPVTRILLAVEEPERTGDRWDDAIAALVEYRLAEVSVPLPDWVARWHGSPGEPWEPQRGTIPLPFPADVAEVPEPFLRRGVHIEGNELLSV